MSTASKRREPLPKAVRLLHALYSGVEVQLKGHTYALCEGGVLGVKAQAYDGDEPIGERYLVSNMLLSDFIAWAESLSDDELFVIGCQAALMDMARERNARRQTTASTRR